MNLPEVAPGCWMGKVLKLDDEPQNRRVGKVKLSVPDLYGDNIPEDDLPWAYPIFPGYIHTQSRAGFFMVPPVGAFVAVLFERGNPQAPRYFGGWTQKGRIPFQFQFSQGDKFPNIVALRGPDGMMIRMVYGERMEFILGESGSFDAENNWTPDGEHNQYDTSIVLDKKQRRFTIRSKYDINVQCKGKIQVRAPQFSFRLMPNQTYDAATETATTDADSPPPKFDLSVFDPDAQQGARIMMEPGQLQGRARHVKGFKDR